MDQHITQQPSSFISALLIRLASTLQRHERLHVPSGAMPFFARMRLCLIRRA